MDKSGEPEKLTGKQVRFLRGLAHSKKAHVIIGGDRVNEAVIGHVDRELETHELIKVRVTDGAKAEMAGIATALCEGTGAHLAQKIGHTLVLYRARKEDDPTIRLPRR
jgi:RNA-binding protein